MIKSLEKYAIRVVTGVIFLFLQFEVLYAQIEKPQTDNGIHIYLGQSVTLFPAIKNYANTTIDMSFRCNDTLKEAPTGTLTTFILTSKLFWGWAASGAALKCRTNVFPESVSLYSSNLCVA